MRFESIAEQAMAEIRERSKFKLYQTDFQAWKADILGYRTYEKMRNIMDTALFADKPRTMIKSANGTAKSFEVSAAISWAAAVFPLGESISIVSAPSVPQLEKVIFAYLKSNFSTAIARDNRLPGWINESLGWQFSTDSGNKFLAFGRKPPEQDAVSVFQGVRSEFGRTYVWFDEAGGMSRQMYTAAEAVMTGEDARFTGIGNPDNSGTDFEKTFRDGQDEYNLFTISAFDLPTLTGERVYPHTVEGDKREAQMLKALTSRTWVEHKQRVWGEGDARYQAKVLGEFPGDSGNAFFGQMAYDKATDKEVVEDGDYPLFLGVDIARYGQDETVVYGNRNGRIRFLEAWGKTDTVTSALRIHDIANRLGATEVRIDSAGVGGGVFDMIDKLPQFDDRVYMVIGIEGAKQAPDPSRWANTRAFNHDYLRTQMVEGLIDLDYEDSELRDQLLAVTFKYNNRNALQITPKDDMKTVMGGSPDRLDAVIYASLDMEWLTGNPVNQLRPGEHIAIDPLDYLEMNLTGPGMPL